jgi:hypothetical protein
MTTGDTYDISLINGMNVPVSMAPTNPSKVSGYTCGTAGGLSTNNPPVPACSWSFNPPGLPMYAVTPGGGKCSGTNHSCPSGQTCGIAYSTGVAPTANLACGRQIGWWNANELCAANNIDYSSVGGPNCTKPVSGQPGTYANMYACNAGGFANSCYTSGAANTCCGCPSWAPPAACANSNPNWTSGGTWGGEGTAGFTHTACPSAYSFPYDDKAATFTCGGSSGNTQGYTITFCPGAKTGFGPVPLK